MKYFGEGLSEVHKELNSLIRKPGEWERARQIFLDLHANLHLSPVSSSRPNEVDALFGDLLQDEYRMMPSEKGETITWIVWHIARIEDLTMGILVNNGDQIFNNYWQEIIHSSITDTGNALTYDEIIQFGIGLDIEAMLAYRNAVGKRTREIVQQLDEEELKRKVTADGLEKIRLEGGVTGQENSAWLLDFWGKKDVAGLLLMPPTRHVILHLNECSKYKQHIRNGKKCYYAGRASKDPIFR
jgi:hypothetical protein